VTITYSGYGNLMYTTDGTNPCGSSTSQYYYGPIVVNKPLVMRAVVGIGGGCGPEAAAAFNVPTASTVTTENAVDVTSTGAVLRGTVNPGGLATQYWFTYGRNCEADGTRTTTIGKLPATTSSARRARRR